MCTEAYTDPRKVTLFWALLCTRERVRCADPGEARQPKYAESLRCKVCTTQASEKKPDGRDSIHSATGAGVARTNRADSAGQGNYPAQVGPRSACRALRWRARRS